MNSFISDIYLLSVIEKLDGYTPQVLNSMIVGVYPLPKEVRKEDVVIFLKAKLEEQENKNDR